MRNINTRNTTKNTPPVAEKPESSKPQYNKNTTKQPKKPRYIQNILKMSYTGCNVIVLISVIGTTTTTTTNNNNNNNNTIKHCCVDKKPNI